MPSPSVVVFVISVAKIVKKSENNNANNKKKQIIKRGKHTNTVNIKIEKNKTVKYSVN